MDRNFKLLLLTCMLLAVIGASACIGGDKDETAKGDSFGENSQDLVVGISSDVNNCILTSLQMVMPGLFGLKTMKPL